MEWVIENGGEAPEELVDLELMAAHSWSWADLQATPLYVRVLAWYRLQMVRAAEAKANERSNSAPGTRSYA